MKVDRASMQYSLESRVPLLDYRLVEFAYNLDAKLKVKNGSMKYLLKKYCMIMCLKKYLTGPNGDLVFHWRSG